MNDYLDFITDLEKGTTTVSPEDLAPELKSEADGLLYSEEKDPEIERVEEKLRKVWHKGKKLTEAIADDEAAYIASTQNPTYEGFMNSNWGNAKVTPERWKKDSTWILKRAKAGSGEMVAGTGSKSAAYTETGGVKQRKEGTPGPYDEERETYKDDGKMSDLLSNLVAEHSTGSLKGSADEMFQDMQNIVKNIILRRSDKRHALIWGDPGVGKTFEVMEICDRHIKQSPTKAKYVYEAGDIGSSMTSLVPFFYKHRNNTIIVLDDNDKMIMANLQQDIMNIIKALLDPKAAESKPISVRANMLKIFQARLDDLEEEEPLKENQHIFEIDVEALREGECVIAIDDNIVVNKKIPLKEAQDLSNMIISDSEYQSRKLSESDLTVDDLRLYEAEKKNNKEFLADLIGDDDEEYEGMTEEDIKAVKSMKASGASEQGEEGASFPRRFLFDSSVIFISNLEQDQINVAVLDRVESVGIKLTMDQFLERLSKIYGGLCKGAKYSNVPQDLRDWAKKCVFTALKGTIEAWQKRKVLWSTPIEINRKMTFRMFEEFTVAWLRYAYDRSERVDGRDLNDKAYRDKLSNELIKDIIRRKIIPFLRQRTKIN
jgi:hypothetical protein